MFTHVFIMTSTDKKLISIVLGAPVVVTLVLVLVQYFFK